MDGPTRIYQFFQLFRSLFTFLGQTNPRYFHVFLHRKMGPRYVSLPKIILCTLGIGVIAPAVRAFVPPVTWVPLCVLPFAPIPSSLTWFQGGKFTIGGSEFLPFWLMAIAFLITGVRRHLDGQRRIIEGEALHTYDRGEPRFFERSFSGILVKEPLIVFVLGVLWAYIALFTGAIHPAFGSFLMVGSVDLWLSEALLARYFTVTVRDEIDAELRAAQMQQMREEALAKKRGPLGRRGGVAAEGPAPFHRAEPGKRS